VQLHAVPLLTNLQELEFPLDHGEAVTDIPVPDQQLLDMFLECIHPALRSAVQAHYRFEVFRGNVTKMDPSLQGTPTSHSSKCTCDSADGLTITTPDKSNQRIIIRTHEMNGNVMMDFGTLMHEIGHGVDHRVASFPFAGKEASLHEHADVVDAHKDEASQLAAYFQDIPEFVAEVFARYSLDRDRTAKNFPKMTKVFDRVLQEKKVFPPSPPFPPLVDSRKLMAAIKAMVPSPLVDIALRQSSGAAVGLWEEVGRLESSNTLRRSAPGKARDATPYVIAFATEDAPSAEYISRQLSLRLFGLRVSGKVSSYNLADSWFRAVITDPQRDALDKRVNHHSFVMHMQLPPAPSWSALKALHDFIDFSEFHGDMCVPCISGTEVDISALKDMFIRQGRLQVNLRIFSIQSMSKAGLQAQILREATAHGYSFSKEALDVMLRMLPENASLDQAGALFREIATAQNLRTESILASQHHRLASAMFYVLKADVLVVKQRLDAETAKIKSPEETLAKMIGLAGPKEFIATLQRQILLNPAFKEGGMKNKFRRLNLLFLGNPGTGKTVVADVIRQILLSNKVVSSTSYQKVPAGDLRSKEQAAALFKNNKNGVIFIDEFHQLSDSTEGKDCLKAMVQYLADPDYAGTVFIGAGYEQQTRAMLKDPTIDLGLESRFEGGFVVFQDYTKDEIGLIFDYEIKKQEREVASPDVRATAIESIFERRRMERNPSNARGVEKFVQNYVIPRQVTRLAQYQADHPGQSLASLVQKIELSDVTLPPRPSMQEFWDGVRDKFVDLEILCGDGGILRQIQERIEVARRKNTSWEQLRLNFLMTGPPGTGKSMIAREIIGPFFHALDVLPSPDLANPPKGYTGAQLQAGYVGQTTAKVDQVFSDGWGKTIFIDEFSGWRTSGFAEEIAKSLLNPLWDNPCKYAVVVADYESKFELVWAVDGGLRSRFPEPQRIHVPRWGAAKCCALLEKIMLQKQRLDVSAHHDVILGHFETMCSCFSQVDESVGFASGRTTEQVADDLVTAYNTACSASPELDSLPVECINSVMSRWIQSLREQVRKADEAASAIKVHMASQPRAATQAAAQTAAAAAPAAARKAGPKLSKEELRKYLAAIESVDTMLGDDGRPKFSQYNDPETGVAQQEADIADENSEYNKELAKRLGVAPAEARKIRVRVAVKVKKMVTKCRTKMEQKFQYHCPWCNQVESQSCAFINHSLEFKIAHSKKKPWMEQLDEFYNEEIEEETFEEREHMMKASAGGGGGA
jgi:SpoVK/Ycf46/Vps4 family AAA+-type ATPase